MPAKKQAVAERIIVNCEYDDPNDTIVRVCWEWSVYEDGIHKTTGHEWVVLDPPEGTFIPYEEVDQATMLSWVEAKVGDRDDTAKIADMMARLEKAKAPKPKEGLPWQALEEATVEEAVQ